MNSWPGPTGLAPLRRLEALLATIRNPGSAAQEGALVDVQAMLAAPRNGAAHEMMGQALEQLVQRARDRARRVLHARVRDAVPLVRFRAQAMQNAVPAGVGAMAAIMGGDDDATKAANLRCLLALQWSWPDRKSVV